MKASLAFRFGYLVGGGRLGFFFFSKLGNSYIFQRKRFNMTETWTHLL